MIKKLLTMFVRLYQMALSPFLGECCRFYPSCSQYAIDAIEKHGCVKGLLLSCKRLSKCHPWHKGGIDFP